MELWHTSKAGELIGDALVPCCLAAPEREDLQRISFFTSRASAECWNASRFFGRVLYRANSEDLPPLEKHPVFPNVRFTRERVPMSALEVVETIEGPTRPDVLELIRRIV